MAFECGSHLPSWSHKMNVCDRDDEQTVGHNQKTGHDSFMTDCIRSSALFRMQQPSKEDKDSPPFGQNSLSYKQKSADTWSSSLYIIHRT